jgi:hypothetical protein
MLLPIKPICEPKKMRKDGTCIIYIQYCFSSGHRTNLNSEIAIPPAFWNERRLCIKADLPAAFGDPSKAGQELRGSENLKIKCGKVHFKEFKDIIYK